jgi:hypothetical protein
MEVGRSGERWEGPKAEDACVHMRRRAKEAKEQREKQRRHELGEGCKEDNVNISYFIDDDIA